MGRPLAFTGGLPQRRRGGAPPPWPLGDVRPLGRGGVASDRPRRGDRGDRRRRGGWLRPHIPVPHADAWGGQVRPYSAAEPVRAATDRRRGRRRTTSNRQWLGQPGPGSRTGRGVNRTVAEAGGHTPGGLGVDRGFGGVGGRHFPFYTAIGASGA